MYRLALLIALAVAACASSGSRPKEEERAVLLVLPPPEESGKTLVGRITGLDRDFDVRPTLDVRTVELEPGRYRLETYFWVARSRLGRDAAGGRTLVIENLQSARIALMEIVVDGGRAYYVRAELRRKEDVPLSERSGFHPLNKGESISDPEQIRLGIARVLAESDFVWRPHLTVLPEDRAQEYRTNR